MIPILVAARTNSQRLPGKTLRNVAGKPVLQWVVDSLSEVANAIVVVATSSDSQDDAIAAWCADHGVRCHRGLLDDVAGRLMQAARVLGTQAFVRISGDSPLIDPALVSHAIKLFELAETDLVTNVQVRTFPKGCSVEVIRVDTLERQLGRFAREGDHEHVTSVLYRHPETIRVTSFTSGVAVGNIQLSIDTEADLRNVEKILQQYPAGARHPGWRRIVDYYLAATSQPSNT